MKDKENDVFAKAAAQMQKNGFPVLVKTAVQDRAQLERLYTNDSDGQSTLGEDTPDPVWFVEERQLNGDWLAIDRADDQDEAEAKLSHVENHLPGTYRLQRSDW
ncbi:hypothetical protein YA0637_22115 [Pseudomonas syringae]|uniref:hypothetical protein n=1 Tax=Pseudomonas syringae TaxID=317 RepID=UPI0018E620F2|nr:hypothetical protein [Pseudomonas syringae]MBI6674240.1 hypothetical protein [Pseudomonas syringae]UOF21353.1 hypothetical protein N023_07555 [Pseudomonas syringae CC440]UZA78932.1 hypothetical protein EZZ79_07910 [Pseudomonas syringae]